MLKFGFISLAYVTILIGTTDTFAARIQYPPYYQDEEEDNTIPSMPPIFVNNPNQGNNVTVTLPSNLFLFQNLHPNILLGASLLWQIQQNSQAQNQQAKQGQSASPSGQNSN